MQPSVFISHGAPSTALANNSYTRALHDFAQNLELPKGIIVMSAHGMSKADTIWLSSPRAGEISYDFKGFAKELYSITYPYKPFSNTVLDQITQSLRPLGAASVEHRHLDHGVWTPLLHMFPKADIPVAQISMPYPSTPQTIFDIGKALRQLRQEGFLLVGSGGAVHNLRMIQWPGEDALDDSDWAIEFNDWLVNKVAHKNADDLLAYETKAPSPRMAHPHPDHLLPLFFTLGAMFETDQVSIIVNEFHMSTLSMFSFAMS